MSNFKSGATRVLVATDIAARGLDVDSISHVINFDVPLIYADYYFLEALKRYKDWYLK